MDQQLTPQNLPQNPSEKTNILNQLLHCWVVPTLWKGSKRSLQTTDLYQPLNEHKSDKLGKELYDEWKKKLAQNGGKEPNILKVIFSVFGVNILLLGLTLAFIELAIRSPQPIYLGWFLEYYDQTENHDIKLAYMWAAIFLLASIVHVIMMNSLILALSHCGMKIRVALCSMIYQKSLKLSERALGETTVGQIVNLLSNDVNRIQLSIDLIHYLWVSPIQTGLCTVLMYLEVGYSALFGMAVVLMLIPLQMFLGETIAKLRRRTAIRSDERIRIMNEMIRGMQVIKMYTWEIPFGKLVENTRKKEIHEIYLVSFLRGLMFSFVMITARTAIYFVLLGYTLLGYIVHARCAFIITAYYSILTQTMAVYFPQAITQVAETLVSLKRIQKFMMYDEKSNKTIVEHLNENADDEKKISLTKKTDSSTYIDFVDVCAQWNMENKDLTLNHLNISFKEKQLTAIVGPMGAGKSSLLSAILGELPILSGKINMNGQISYGSQDLWLFASTVRANILFGQQMNEQRYKEVVKVCALERDFELFPNGDQTIVGERGASLSGGQRARISLARSCYRQAAIYLFDDPLSAVDTHVGRHLFDLCLKQFLSDKIVILVTDQLQYVQEVDQIIIMGHGKIEATGTYDDIKKSDVYFAKLITKINEKCDDEPDTPHGEKQPSLDIKKDTNDTPVAQHSETVDLTKKKHSNNADEEPSNISMLSMYITYVSAGSSIFWFLLVVALFVVSQVVGTCSDYFVCYWVNNNAQKAVNLSRPFSFRFVDGSFPYEYPISRETYRYIYIYTGLIVANFVLAIVRAISFFAVAVKSAIYLHKLLYNGIRRASMYFFNTNPSGRILNRFSQDLGNVDEVLPTAMFDVGRLLLAYIGQFVVIAIVNPWFLIPGFVLLIIFLILRHYYSLTAKHLEGIESATRSPMYSYLNATLMGLSTIRSYNAEEMLTAEFNKTQDFNSSAYYLLISSTRTFNFFVDILYLCYMIIVTFVFFALNESSGSVGMVITQVMVISFVLQWGLRQSTEMDNLIYSVGRIEQYGNIEPEKDIVKENPNQIVPKDWPESGDIKFDNLSLQYCPDPNSPYVLKHLKFNITAGEKIGIVGRTGAGKSSMINALFRLSYNTGAICIDGIDTGSISLSLLRQKISIIPQEPVLFSNTMRFNLDPFNEYSDETIWQAVTKVKLKDVIVDLPHGLESKITEGGGNFSMGQRQLVCFARAILRNNKILIMDEATANVDPLTDNLIQQTVREQFADCTVITIAHRLNTVIDSDRIFVMDAGQLIESGEPYGLMTKRKEPRVFYHMVEEMGHAAFYNLLDLAKNASEKRKKKK